MNLTDNIILDQVNENNKQNILLEQIRAIDNIEDRLKLFSETNNLDFDRFSQKTCFLAWIVTGFDDQMDNVQYANDLAYRIVLEFKNKFGELIIERESSYCIGKFTTSMDEALNNQYDFTCECVANWLIRIHMKALKFKPSKDIHPFALYRLYCYDPTYPMTDELFSELKQVKCQFEEELQQYLHHPNKIEQWMNKNPNKNVLEYLN